MRIHAFFYKQRKFFAEAGRCLTVSEKFPTFLLSYPLKYVFKMLFEISTISLGGVGHNGSVGHNGTFDKKVATTLV